MFGLSSLCLLGALCACKETICRMLEVIFVNCGNRLPNHICILQDNCQRECKNGKMLAAVTKLKILSIVDRISLAFPVKGHTHGPLDATGGQACVKCSNSEFNSPHELTQLYDAGLCFAVFSGVQLSPRKGNPGNALAPQFVLGRSLHLVDC